MENSLQCDWLNVPPASPDERAREQALARQAILTKPPGALGRLEDLAVRLAAMQGVERPCLDRLRFVVFAGDHGIAAEGISAFPQAVTTEMVRNFARGGAAISVLAKELDARLEVVNLGTVADPGALPGVLDARLGPGTANLAEGPAMSEEQVIRGIHAGRHAAERAAVDQAQLFVGGEMGIGNTTAAAALAAALLDVPSGMLAGPGTGLDPAGVARKAATIERAINIHAGYLGDPLEALRRLGGFEIAGLTGAFIACAQMGLPVLVDGFIATVAALTATRLCKGADDWFIYGHASAEPGHARVLEALDAVPLLQLGMRLGEGSGAAVAVSLLRHACALHNNMATFAEAEVSDGSSS